MERPELVPLSGEGIDVPLDIGGTTVTFDVALEVPGGPLVVAECRRWRDGVKQEGLFALAKKLQLLRESIQRPVEGICFARRRHQLGALRVAAHDEITMVVTEQDQPSNTPSLYFYEYDPKTKTVSRKGKLYVAGCSIGHSSAVGTPEVSRKVTQAPVSEQ